VCRVCLQACPKMSRPVVRPASEDTTRDRRGMVEVSPPRQLSCDVPFTYRLTPASPTLPERGFKKLCQRKARKLSKQMSTLYDTIHNLHLRNSTSSDEERTCDILLEALFFNKLCGKCFNWLFLPMCSLFDLVPGRFLGLLCYLFAYASKIL
jgi:hypothetical protein